MRDYVASKESSYLNAQSGREQSVSMGNITKGVCGKFQMVKKQV